MIKDKSILTRYALLLFFCVILTGCGPALRVYSDPVEASIFLNGADTGLKTPNKIRVANLPVGISHVTVEKAGYKTITPVQFVDVSVSVGNVVWSILWPPVIIKNLCTNFWKSMDSPRDEQLEIFQLEKTTEASQDNSVGVHAITPSTISTVQ